MELERYFDFLSPKEIRIRGMRPGIETVLKDYLEGTSPEEIEARYRSLSLEQVYAALLYYFHNRTQMDAYLEAGRAATDQAWLEWQRHPSPAIERLRALKARRKALQKERGISWPDVRDIVGQDRNVLEARRKKGDKPCA